MNSNKFNLYKNSIYFLIANGAVSLVALVIGLVFGVNYATSIEPGNLLFACVMTVLLSLVAIFLYVGFTTSFAKAFGVVLVVAHNVLLSTALITLVRIPVGESIVMAYALIVAISAIFAILPSAKLKAEDVKKQDKNQLSKNMTKSNFKAVVITSVAIVVLLVFGLVVASQTMFDLVREFLVMTLVIIYGAFTIQNPIMCYFISKINSKKKKVVDGNVKNQKVIKAVSVDDQQIEEDQQIEDGADIEQGDLQNSTQNN